MTNWSDSLSKSDLNKGHPAHAGLFLREDEIRLGMELLYFAYRDYAESADAILASAGFGRAHHRVLYFVSRNPGTTVSGLLGLLKITKQSLSRVLKQLISEGYIEMEQGTTDRRQRLLTLTEKGKVFENKLFQEQKEKMAQAYKAAGVEAVDGFREVLLNLMHSDSRESILNK